MTHRCAGNGNGIADIARNMRNCHNYLDELPDDAAKVVDSVIMKLVECFDLFWERSCESEGLKVVGCVIRKLVECC